MTIRELLPLCMLVFMDQRNYRVSLFKHLLALDLVHRKWLAIYGVLYPSAPVLKARADGWQSPGHMAVYHSLTTMILNVSLQVAEFLNVGLAVRF